MQRRRKSRQGTTCLLLTATLILLAGVMQRPALATEDLIEVFPTGDADQDLGAVQDAVDMVADGGTVLLRATTVGGIPMPFNFGQAFPDTVEEAFENRGVEGEGSTVLVSRSVTIRGEVLDDDFEDGWDEREDEGGARTTIFGGFEPIQVDAPGADVLIEKLAFDCARFKTLSVLAGGNVVIRNNRFGKVTFFETDNLVVGAPRTFGIGISGDTGGELVTADTVLIEKNLLDLNPGNACPGLEDDPTREDLADKFAVGVFVSSVDADVTIQHNLVRNTAYASISVLDGRGTTLCRWNKVNPGPSVFSGPFFFGGIGIESTSGTFAPEEGQRGLAVISGNKVTCENKDCVGIVVGDTADLRGRAIVLNNRVRMTAPELPDLPFAAGIEVFIGNSIVAFNKIEGQSNFAILLEGDIGTGVGDLANDNRIFGNNVGNFTPLSTDYFGIMLPEPADYVLSSANDNLLAGRSGKVFDLGQGNVIKGGLEVINGGS